MNIPRRTKILRGYFCLCRITYMYALYKVGIQNFMVSGYGVNASHAWNLVRIDGNYYYCDWTYDDAEDGAGYKYFNISTDKLCENHTIDSKYITLPECNRSSE